MAKINGLCVSKGNVKGVAYIVREEKTPENLAPNTILVMKVLDREMLISLDKNVVGVIAEFGNIGSHGSGILRQLKIPCVLRIKNATTLLSDGEEVELCGDRNCIVFGGDRSEKKGSAEEESGKLYRSVSRRPFEEKDIRLQQEWVSIRPTRCYQKLRFEMFREVHERGPQMMFGLPLTQVKQNERGVMIEYGAPRIDDLCNYLIVHPHWLREKCARREEDIAYIYAELRKLMPLVQNAGFDTVRLVFEKGIELYQILFRYMYMSQATSEEMLDIYLDFAGSLTGSKMGKDLLGLESEYVKNSLQTGIYPGISQIWSSMKSTPYIWEGTVNFEPLPVDSKIEEAIAKRGADRQKYEEDYRAFREIVPLIYQLSEEYYYTSSSIHSFVSWSLVQISEYAKRISPSFTVEELYGMSLNEARELIEKITKTL